MPLLWKNYKMGIIIYDFLLGVQPSIRGYRRIIKIMHIPIIKFSKSCVYNCITCVIKINILQELK